MTASIYETSVQNLCSPHSGAPVANQYIISDDEHIAFQSYRSLVAVYDGVNDVLTLGCDWDYSKTTMKYLAVFLREWCPRVTWSLLGGDVSAKNIRKAIADGDIRYDPDMQ